MDTFLLVIVVVGVLIRTLYNKYRKHNRLMAVATRHTFHLRKINLIEMLIIQNLNHYFFLLRFRKGTRFSKDDKCVYCHEAIDAFVTQGQRCIDCKQLYHTKCIQNKGVITMPCTSPVTANTRVRTKNRKRIMKENHSMLAEQSKASVSSNFNLTGTSEFMDRTDKIISDATELQAMQNFITKKIYQMGLSDNEKQSEVSLEFGKILNAFYNVENLKVKTRKDPIF